MPPPTSTSPDSHKGKRVLNFLYLDPGGVEGEMLSPVTSGLGWVRAAGSQGWVTDFLSLRLPTPAPACSHFALSASTVHRPGQISLLLKPSIASQSPGLSPDFTASCHTCHLASRGGHFSVSLLLYAVPTQSLVPATSTLPGAPPSVPLLTPTILSSCQIHRGVTNPRFMTPGPAGTHKGRQLYVQAPPHRLPRSNTWKPRLRWMNS